MSAFFTKTGSHCSVNLAFVPISEVILGVGLSPVSGEVGQDMTGIFLPQVWAGCIVVVEERPRVASW